MIHFIKYPRGEFTFRVYARAIHGLSFRIATPSDKENLYRFRYNIYIKEGYIKPEDHPDKQFSDQYDLVSVSVIAVKNNEIFGAGRVTHYSNLGLPTLDYFNITLPKDINIESVVEMGRFMVHPKYRGKSRIVSLGLSLQLKSYVRSDTKVKWLIAFMSDKVRSAFHSLVPFNVLKELPLEQEHVEARGLLPGYWNKGEIYPVIAQDSELL